jgi:RHS repeat-associated protein
MSSPAEVISTPRGGGALQGIGEKFSPDLYTGTGNFTVPIALPPGRNGFNPQLSLVYSTGNGNGPFGLGWNLSVPGVSRKTSKGVPQYGDDSKDTFILSGAEDLVPVGGFQGVPQYRPRTEGLFARILHYKERPTGSPPNNHWEVKSKDGLTSFYGTPGAAGNDPAVITDPIQKPQSKIFAWKLTRTTDPFGNVIQYLYERDKTQTEGVHQWDQLYLSQIQYVDYGDPKNPSFLVTVKFSYADRPDHFSDYRAGFEIRTIQRCTRIDILGGTDGKKLIRTYHIDYADQDSSRPEMRPLNGCSVLHQIKVEGHDGTDSEWLPPLEFGHSQFEPVNRKFIPLTGTLPTNSLVDKSLELVDLFGAGLPDILEMNGTVRYWRNTGQGQFALPHQMDEAPAGVGLADAGVQILDANGDGRADLLVTTQAISGYYPLKFGGLWDEHSFQRYRVAPSFDLKDPEVRLVDLDGDGVTDAIRSSTRLECYFNDPEQGWIGSRRVERKTLDVFPDVDFADEGVKWADMTGDGLQDIALVHDGLVEYWPSLGRGDWGKRIEMPGPRFPWGYDPKRVLLGDVDGDGAADLVYVDDTKVTLWINQCGNDWSPPITIQGTPPVSDLDSVRLIDLLGNGIAGVLWSKNANGLSPTNYFFLDFTGGIKPYLLNEMNNHMGSTTRVEYKSSTWFYLQDEHRPATTWVTPLPFPVQVVARVETRDQFSGGKLTTEYSYHHGYWDGFEREFRGFGRVDHRDTELFRSSAVLPPQYFSPPTETRTWFHQGAIGDHSDGWAESDSSTSVPGQRRFTGEYYQEPWPGGPPSAQVLSRPSAVVSFISGLPLPARRDAFRSMRGKVLRTELYALEGSNRQSRPYTVTEHVYGVREESPPDPGKAKRLRIFFPFALSQRTTQWERGNDPLSVFNFSDDCTLSDSGLQTADYDPYGQPLSQISIAVPRGRAFQLPAMPSEPYLATQTVTSYVQRDDSQRYIVDRVSSATTYEISKDGRASIFELAKTVQAGSASRDVVAKRINFYDGNSYWGLPFGQIGDYGVLTRTESLVFTDAILQSAYGVNRPPYLSSNVPPNWTNDYPQKFRDLLPAGAGYLYQPGGASTPYVAGYYCSTDRQKYDFQESPLQSSRGLLIGKKDALANETTIVYDLPYQFLPVRVTDAAGLKTQADYDYRVLQPNLVTDQNGNQTSYTFSPIGLPQQILVMGQPGQNFGDTPAAPGVRFTYNLMGVDSSGLPVPVADLGQPVSVRTVRRVHHASEKDVQQSERDQTIESIQYSDGFGRVVQTRSQAEDVLFDSVSPGGPVFGDAALPANQSQPAGDAVGQRTPAGKPFVVVSGWQIYDNKGQVVEKYEPFYSVGWDYAEPNDVQLGQKATLYYDPRGHVIRTVNPDGSEQRVVYGVPGTVASPDLANPDIFEPTAWEAYTYDANDNVGRTHPLTSMSYQQHWNTPSSIVIDALGRTVKAIERNREKQNGSWSPIVEYTTLSTYDILGNLLTVTDPLGRTAFSYTYDFLKRILSAQSIDAGARLSITDAIGKLVEQRDAKGALILHSYDALNRLTRLWARDAAGQTITLREKIIYGDDSPGSGYSTGQAAALNLLCKPYKHYDEAGLLTFAAYDFKGNLRDKIRNVIAESALLAVFTSPPPIEPFRVDWETMDSSILDAAEYESTVSYDALNRVQTMQYPKDVDRGPRKSLTPRYDSAGALESVQMNGATFVERIAYNAKGQRILIAYGNGLMTRYAYDPKTFRLLRMRTESYATPIGSPAVYHPTAPANPLQEYAYEYDFVGNILAIHDRTPSSGIPNTILGVNALDRSFVYDPIYRLISATGRECAWDAAPLPPPWDDAIRPIDLTKATSYAENYQYDRVGNMALWKHNQIDSSGHSSGVNRQFALVPGNNRLNLLTVGSSAPIAYQYTYDASGNLVKENTDRHFEWDQSDRMRVFRIQPDTLPPAPPSIYAQYLYDSGGQRVVKLVRDQSGGFEKTMYIDGVFEHQKSFSPAGTVENNSLHVMDNKNRIAVVRVGDALPGDGASDKKIKYHFGDHLGSSNVVVDDIGNWINHEEYLPYGETSFGSFARKRYRFTGKERDEESSFYYHGARYYAPWLARWISPDPIVRKTDSGHSQYSHVANNPLIFVDPTGCAEVKGALSKGQDVSPVSKIDPGSGIQLSKRPPGYGQYPIPVHGAPPDVPKPYVEPRTPLTAWQRFERALTTIVGAAFGVPRSYVKWSLGDPVSGQELVSDAPHLALAVIPWAAKGRQMAQAVSLDARLTQLEAAQARLAVNSAVGRNNEVMMKYMFNKAHPNFQGVPDAKFTIKDAAGKTVPGPGTRGASIPDTMLPAGGPAVSPLEHKAYFQKGAIPDPADVAQGHPQLEKLDKNVQEGGRWGPKDDLQPVVKGEGPGITTGLPQWYNPPTMSH